MNRADLQALTRRPPVVIAGLTILAILGFIVVNRLVHRFAEQQKALARHLYAQGLAEQQAGASDHAIEHFRAALLYTHDNFDYQLALARALRDTGRTEEAEAYLVNLWEHSPQDGNVNLALGRLWARQQSLDKTIQYYHYAIYGVWASDPEANRLNTWFELIERLLKMNARPQAQAELITLSAELPHRIDLQLRTASLFMAAQDYDHALAEYRAVLRGNRDNASALQGAGAAAFHLARFAEAGRYLQEAIAAGSQDEATVQQLELVRTILATDPFNLRLSTTERGRRVRTAFQTAGKRLETCAANLGIDLHNQSSGGNLPGLESRWLEIKAPVTRRSFLADTDVQNSALDLAFQIEQETQQECGPPSGIDQALLLIAQNHPGAEP